MKLIRTGDILFSRESHEVAMSMFLVDTRQRPGGAATEALVSHGDGNLWLFGKELNEERGGPDFVRVLYKDSAYKTSILRSETASLFIKKWKRRREAARTIQTHWRRYRQRLDGGVHPTSGQLENAVHDNGC